jgi:hypothetical protein
MVLMLPKALYKVESVYEWSKAFIRDIKGLEWPKAL